VLQVLRDNAWIVRHWMNNNAESVNRLLKEKADWRQLPVSSCIENINDLVKLQFLDLRAALHGEGNFVLVPSMSRHLVASAIWSTSSTEWKEQKFMRFLKVTGSRQPVTTVTSKDGLLSMPATPRVARKPGRQDRRAGRDPHALGMCARHENERCVQ